VNRSGPVITVTLDSMAYGGDAVGRHGGKAVFVPLGVPGDRARVRVVEPHRSYDRAEILSLEEPSSQRIAPRCPHFGACGGCQWQMIGYQQQLEHKKKVLAETMARIGGLSVDGIAVLADGTGWSYRNKAQLPVSRSDAVNRLGFYHQGSHRIVEIRQCPVLVGELETALTAVRATIERSGLDGYCERERQGLLRHVVMRYSRLEQAVALVLVTAAEQPLTALADDLLRSVPGARTVWQNVNATAGNAILGDRWLPLVGQGFLTEQVGAVRLRLSMGAFLQANVPLAEQAYSRIQRGLQLEGGETVVDLYCGVGAISLDLAARCRTVIGIEENVAAVDDARANAGANGLENCTFIAGRAEDALAGIERADGIVLDPPRQGCQPAVVRRMIELGPRRIAYLSCNPTTLARDLKALAAAYELESLALIDFFPQTYHIETLAILRSR
jgi:23S rRNA (uracil1939-C5)-methyltransferase